MLTTSRVLTTDNDEHCMEVRAWWGGSSSPGNSFCKWQANHGRGSYIAVYNESPPSSRRARPCGTPEKGSWWSGGKCAGRTCTTGANNARRGRAERASGHCAPRFGCFRASLIGTMPMQRSLVLVNAALHRLAAWWAPRFGCSRAPLVFHATPVATSGDVTLRACAG